MKKIFELAPMPSMHECFNATVFDALKRLDCEVHVGANFSMQDHAKDKEYAKKLRDEGVIVHDLPFIRRSFSGNFRCASVIKDILKANDFDLVHAHSETAGLITRMAMIKNGHTKYVYTPHGMSFYKGSSLKSQLLYRPIERWICSGMDANLGMNQEEIDVLTKWDKSKARFIHGIGVNLSALQDVVMDISSKKKELGIAPEKKVILNVAELSDRKNQKVILEAIAKLKDKYDFVLLICGEGANRQKYERLAQDLGVADRVFMPGFRYDITELFHIGDIFVFPSIYEGLPVSLMQAMAVGMPVVCSDIRGSRDLIKHGVNGFLHKTNDANQLSQYIDILLERPDVCREQGEKNIAIVEDYSYDRVKDEMFNIYSELLD